MAEEQRDDVWELFDLHEWIAEDIKGLGRCLTGELYSQWEGFLSWNDFQDTINSLARLNMVKLEGTLVSWVADAAELEPVPKEAAKRLGFLEKAPLGRLNQNDPVICD